MAAVKELTVEQKLRALFELQKIDSKIDEIKVLKGELPMEVADLEDELTGLQTRISNIEEEIKALEASIAEYKNARKDSESLIAKYNKQQDNVKNNREFDALTKEIELQNLEIQLSDKKIKDTQEEIVNKEAYLEESKAAIDVKVKDLETKKVELEKIIEETDKEEKDLQQKFEKASSSIEERLITAYTKIKHAYINGLAVVKVERDACGGCFNKVPPQRQAEIKQRKKIIVCEHCGRILVDTDIDG